MAVSKCLFDSATASMNRSYTAEDALSRCICQIYVRCTLDAETVHPACFCKVSCRDILNFCHVQNIFSMDLVDQHFSMIFLVCFRSGHTVVFASASTMYPAWIQWIIWDISAVCLGHLRLVFHSLEKIVHIVGIIRYCFRHNFVYTKPVKSPTRPEMFRS